MNPTSIFFCILLVIAQLTLPKKWAVIPLIIAACYFPRVAKIDIGPFTFSVVRILAVFVTLRIIVRSEMIKGSLNELDKLMIVWTIWLLFVSIFKIDPIGSLIQRLGKLSDTAILYFVVRCLCRSKEDVFNIMKFATIALIPISIEMFQEEISRLNWFFLFGGIPDVSVRDGDIRARGPFSHPILAGTVGSTFFPIALSFYKTNKKLSFFGMAGCIIMTFTSGSSGPIMSIVFSIIALLIWKKRSILPVLLKLFPFVYIFLELSMTKPAYYIIAKINLTGSSTGYHRAALIQSSFVHLNEWWLLGTEYTRHWMPTGVSWSPNHTDITNHFIAQGVSGGLLQMSLYILFFITAFRYVGKLSRSNHFENHEKFMLWAMGSSLFAHAASQISVSYFDQSILFVYLTLGIISSLYTDNYNISLKAADSSI